MIRAILFLLFSLCKDKELDPKVAKENQKKLNALDMSNVTLFLENSSEETSAFSPLSFHQLEVMMTEQSEETEAFYQAGLKDGAKRSNKFKFNQTCVCVPSEAVNESEFMTNVMSDKDPLESYNNFTNSLMELEKEHKLEIEESSDKKKCYHSYVYSKDKWRKSFVGDKTTKADFFTKEKKEEKFSMRRGGKIRLTSIEGKNKNDFKMVVLPFEKEDGKVKRVMVYLIPEDRSYDLSKLWDDFKDYTEGDIEGVINKSEGRNVRLQVPKMERFVSRLDVTKMFEKKHSIDSSQMEVTMTTFLDVVEEGVSDDSMFQRFNCVQPYITIEANVPHIAMVYDFSIERILLVIKYTGIEK